MTSFAQPGPTPAGEAGKLAPPTSGLRGGGVVGQLLRVPLVLKIAGANLLVAAVTVGVVWHEIATSTNTIFEVVLALTLGVLISVCLTSVALRPLRDMERTLHRFQEGDHGARVPGSQLADEDIERVGATLNHLLDGLQRDRERLRALAERVMVQNDEERARLARELYDSTAQSIAALLLELSVAATTAADATSQERLERVRRIAADVLEEIRTLSHAAHPRLLEDRGLSVAMMQLVREYTATGTARVTYERSGDLDDVDASIASVVYRLAQAALRSAVQQRNAENVHVRAQTTTGDVVLEVEDDGVPAALGDTAEVLEAIRHRVELVGGTVDQYHQEGRGRVRLRVPQPSKRPAPSRVGALVS